MLLKVVVQAIPTFAMSCFKLPSGLLNDIEMMIRKFWWRQRGDQRKIHWKNWETLCKPKALGGMGFKDLENFNEAKLAKQVWRLLVDRSSLFYRVFSAKYFPSGSIFDAKVALGSYAWQSIAKARKLSKPVCFGAWGTEGRLTSAEIGGCLEETRLVLFLQRMRMPQIGKSQNCWQHRVRVGMISLWKPSSCHLKHKESRAFQWLSWTRRIVLHGRGASQELI